MLVKCEYCRGSGFPVCPQCDGRKSVPCACAQGEDPILPQRQSCEACSGARVRPCQHCSGQGTIRCEGCVGGGFVDMSSFA